MFDRVRVAVAACGLCALTGVASANPVFYGVTNTPSSTLVRFDMGAMTATTVAVTTSVMEDCDFDASGTLWAIRQGNIGGFPPTVVCQAYTIDLTTGAATLHGDFGSGATLSSLAFRSSNSAYYTVNQSGGTTSGHLVTADMNAGTVTTVAGAPQSSTPYRVDALAFSPSGTLYGIWNSNAGGPFGSNIYNLVSFDLGTGQRTLIGAITGSTSQAFYALRFDSAGNAYTVDSGSGDVYTVNTGTGHGTFLFAGGPAAVGTRGLGFIPAPGTGLLLGLGLAAMRRRR
jgi:hypothetical protein